MDSQIGRIFDFIKQDSARWENTLVLFLSDNGASAEIMVRGDGHNPNAAAGSAQSYLCLGPGWSSVSNTPFRRHKTWVHEGGIATPMIAHWPAGIQSDPNPVSTPYHVIDIAPTILALASKHAGTEFESPDPKFPGLSFAKEFQEQANRASRSESRVLWWQHEANRALRDGNLKIVASGKDSPWELYDLAQDRAETENLATQRPQELERLAKTWNELTEQFRLQATAED
jgi:arylsulfatase